MVDQRSSSAPNVHNIINDANFQVRLLLLQQMDVVNSSFVNVFALLYVRLSSAAVGIFTPLLKETFICYLNTPLCCIAGHFQCKSNHFEVKTAQLLSPLLLVTVMTSVVRWFWLNDRSFASVLLLALHWMRLAPKQVASCGWEDQLIAYPLFCTELRWGENREYNQYAATKCVKIKWSSEL